MKVKTLDEDQETPLAVCRAGTGSAGVAMTPGFRDGTLFQESDKRFEVHGARDIKALSFIAAGKLELAQLVCRLHPLGSACYAGTVRRSNNWAQHLALRL